MTDENEIVRQRQLAIRRELDRRGISLKVVALDSGLPYSTVCSYFPADPHSAPAIMSAASQFALLKAIPAEVMSLLLPAGLVIVEIAEHLDYDEVSAHCRDYVDAKDQAHHPDSPGGRDIADCEGATLRARHAALRAIAA